MAYIAGILGSGINVPLLVLGLRERHRLARYLIEGYPDVNAHNSHH